MNYKKNNIKTKFINLCQFMGFLKQTYIQMLFFFLLYFVKCPAVMAELLLHASSSNFFTVLFVSCEGRSVGGVPMFKCIVYEGNYIFLIVNWIECLTMNAGKLNIIICMLNGYFECFPRGVGKTSPKELVQLWNWAC